MAKYHPSQKLPPEVALIGWLMLVAGAFALIRTPVMTVASNDVPFLANIPPDNLFARMVNNDLGLILNIAYIVVGIGLLCTVEWARRGAQVVFGCAIFRVFFARFAFSHPGMPEQFIVAFLLTLVNAPARDMCKLLVLSTLRMRESLGERRRPGFLTEIAERVYRPLARTTPVVLVLIALDLFSRAVYGIFQNVDAYSRQHPVSDLSSHSLQLYFSQSYFLWILYLCMAVAGICLLLRPAIGRYIAMGAFGLLLLQDFIICGKNISFGLARRYLASQQVGGILLFILSSILTYGIYIYFLKQSQVQPPAVAKKPVAGKS